MYCCGSELLRLRIDIEPPFFKDGHWTSGNVCVSLFARWFGAVVRVTQCTVDFLWLFSIEDLHTFQQFISLFEIIPYNVPSLARTQQCMPAQLQMLQDFNIKLLQWLLYLLSSDWSVPIDELVNKYCFSRLVKFIFNFPDVMWHHRIQ